MSNTTTKNAILGSIVHSVRFGELELISKGMIIYSDSGIIEEVKDLTKTPVDVSFMSNFKQVHDHTGKLIIPGFIDAHCHAPQYVFTGTGMDLPLLAWLEKYTFPCEAKFSNAEFAKVAYAKSIQRHLKCGTTFASYFATIHNEAGKILVDVINRVGQRAFVGKVSMDRNSPDFYVEDTVTGCEDAEEFVQYVLGQTATGREFLRTIGSTAVGGDDESASNKRTRVDRHLESSSPSSSAHVKEASSDVDEAESRYRAVSLAENEQAWSYKSEERHEQDGHTPGLVDEDSLRYGSFGADAAHTVFASSAFNHSDSSASCPWKQGPSLLNKPFTPLVMPCVTPRFVPTCTPTMMARLGELSLRYGLPVQSHLSESQGEIDWVSSLHPDCSTYADVYDKYGLLHSSSYMAHCCHSSPEERVLLSQRETGVVHCASSNFMLSSGVMDVRTFLGEGINVALGTDVAGGYSPSMLDALRQCIVASRVKSFDHRQAAWVAAMSVAATVSYDDNAAETRSTSTESSTSEVHGAHTKATGGGPTAEDVAALQQFSADYRPLTYSEAFHLATMGGAEVLGMGDVLGNFLAGKKLDCLVVDVDVANSPIDTFEGEGPLDHFQKFLFLGDDRNVQHVFVDGVMVI